MDHCIADRIKHELQARIEGGELPAGVTLPSEHELAAEYGTSRSQARQALRDLQREGYIMRSQGRRSIVTGADRQVHVYSPLLENVVAIAIPEFQSRYCRGLMNGFMATATKRGFQTLSYNMVFDPHSEALFLNRVLRSGLRGLAIWVNHDDPAIRMALAALGAASFPIVLLDRHISDIDLDSVCTDNETIGHALTRKLLDKGHRNIAFFSDGYVFSSQLERLAGYRRALADAGLSPNPAWLGEASDDEGAPVTDTVARVVAFRDAPTAFVCTHDSLAMRVWEALRRLGYEVPGDMELAAPDDDLRALTRDIPMEALSQPGFDIGARAAELMVARIAQPDRPHEQVQLPPTPPMRELDLGDSVIASFARQD